MTCHEALPLPKDFSSWATSAPLKIRTEDFCAAAVNFPWSSKSFPVAIRAPFTLRALALKSALSGCLDCAGVSTSGRSVATKSQYCAGTNPILSRSRSTTKRVATDWTRPADRPVRILRHSKGETSYPTKRSRMRRVSWALTRSVSSSRGLCKARSMASAVISWKTMRLTGTLGCNTSNKCHAMASPSRSSSVASSSSSAFFNRDLSSLTFFFFPASTV